MARNSEQKIKLLVLYEILYTKTDESYPMSVKDIIKELKEQNIVVTRQTLYNDIKILNQYGYEVLCVKGRNNKYFVIDRKFELPEIQSLICAIGAAKFLTRKKTLALAEKVALCLGKPQAEQLRERYWQ